MPPTHWSDLVGGNSASGERPRSAASVPASSYPAHLRERAQAGDRQLRDAAQQNTHFDALLRQRESLELRMQNAMSGGRPAIDSRDAARFQVPTMAQRRAEYAEWERRRERDRPVPPPQESENSTGHRLAEFGRSISGAASSLRDLPFRQSAGEQPGGSPLDPSQWMARRDAIQASGQDEYNRLDRRLGRARAQASSFTNPLRDLDRQFDEADRKMEAEGLSSERRELAAMKSQMGLDQFNRPASQADDIFSAFRSTTDRARDAGERVEQNWLSRRDAIGGQDMESYIRPYNAMKDRVLGMSTSAFADRADRSREAALDRGRQRRQEHSADEARRSRAIERRRARQDAS